MHPRSTKYTIVVLYILITRSDLPSLSSSPSPSYLFPCVGWSALARPQPNERARRQRLAAIRPRPSDSLTSSFSTALQPRPHIILLYLLLRKTGKGQGRYLCPAVPVCRQLEGVPLIMEYSTYLGKCSTVPISVRLLSPDTAVPTSPPSFPAIVPNIINCSLVSGWGALQKNISWD